MPYYVASIMRYARVVTCNRQETIVEIRAANETEAKSKLQQIIDSGRLNEEFVNLNWIDMSRNLIEQTETHKPEIDGDLELAPEDDE